MDVQELKNRFELKANLDADIKTFMFDDLDKINSKDRNKSYPLILMNTPQSVIRPFQDHVNEPLYEFYAITIYALMPWKKGDKDTVPLEAAYRQIEDIGERYLQNVLASGGNEFGLAGDKGVSKQRGHHMHVDQLVGCSYTFTLRVFKSLCYDLGQPTNLVAVATSTTVIDLSWTDNASGETGYEVWRSNDGLSFQLISTEAADVVVYSDTGLTVDTQYYYRVRAVDSNGGGQFSNIVAMRTDNAAADGAVDNSDASYLLVVPSGTTQTLPDIDHIDSDLSTSTLPAQTPMVCSPASASGIAYKFPQITGQTTDVSVTGDALYNEVNGLTNNYTPPSMPATFQELDEAHATPFLNLKYNNEAANKNRFTDDANGQTYTSGIIKCHLTKKMWLLKGTGTWSSAITAANGATDGGHSDWRIPDMNELGTIIDRQVGLNYAPFNYNATQAWTSNTSAANTVRAEVFETDSRARMLDQAKTSSYKVIYVRNW